MQLTHAHTRFARLLLISTTVLSVFVFAGPAAALTRDTALRRAEVWVAKNVPYSQSRYAREDGSLVPTSTLGVPLSSYGQSQLGWRTDCSGFISMSLGLVRSDGTPLSLDTGTLGSRMTTVAPADLRPGDVILRPNNLVINGKRVAYGHAVIFVRWTDGTMSSYVGYHESSGRRGTVAQVIRFPFGSEVGFSPYRYKKMEDVRLRKSRRWFYASKPSLSVSAAASEVVR